jgi:hypothetical protein
LWYLLASEEFPSNPFSASAPTALPPPATCDLISRSFAMDDVLRQAEALLRFSGEVENRMVESGLGGVNGVIERYIQLRQALDRLSQRELDWAKGEVDRLIATLTGVAEQLEQLRAIKLAIVDQR